MADATVPLSTAAAPGAEATSAPVASSTSAAETAAAAAVAEGTETTADTSASKAPEWPALEEGHPLAQLVAKLPELLKVADYHEVYGVDLKSSSPFHVKLILQKFLRANQGDLEKAQTQLLNTLKWRKGFDPLKAVDETFARDRFGGLGYIITLENVPESPNKTDTATFNIYGAVKDQKYTFEDIDGFMRWRVALQELGVRQLKLQEATKPIPDYGDGADPYQGVQIHDYLQVSFLRQNAYTKAATKQIIATMRDNYPETLSRKFFVNVPIIMGWIFTAATAVMPKETAKKLSMLSYGEYLEQYLGPSLPSEYGGKGVKLSETKYISPKLDGEAQ